MRREEIFRLVDIGGIVDHHCFNILFLILMKLFFYFCSLSIYISNQITVVLFDVASKLLIFSPKEGQRGRSGCKESQTAKKVRLLESSDNQKLPGACNRSPGSKLLSITTQLHCGGLLGGRARLPDTILKEDHPMTIPTKFSSY